MPARVREFAALSMSKTFRQQNDKHLFNNFHCDWGASMKYRIILCEDNDFVREMLQFFLKDMGYEVFSYENPADCPLSSVSQCKDNSCIYPCTDMIITDVSMPKINGLEFIGNLKKKGCGVTNIALVSGYWSEKNMLQAKMMDCSVFFKPLNLQKLSAWLGDCEGKVDPMRKLSNQLLCS